MTTRLSGRARSDALATLKGWSDVQGRDAIQKSFKFADFNEVASIGAFWFGLTQVYFFLFVVLPVLRGKGAPAVQRPWNDPDGKGAEGLEWEVPSPAPFHTFETPPRLDVTATRVLDARVQPENPAGVH